MRQLLIDLPALLGDALAVPPAVRHRLERVLRLKPGTPLVLADGNGRQVPAVYQGSTFELTAPATQQLPPLPLTLACGVLKGERFDWLVEKAAELGVTALQPLQTTHCVVKALGAGAAGREQRWQALADAAFEQCGRPWRMRVLPVVTLPMLLGLGSENIRLFACSERTPCAPLAHVVKACRENLPAGGLGLVVGPEGGLADDEWSALRRHDCIEVSLGDAVLRAETAALAAAVIARAVLDRQI